MNTTTDIAELAKLLLLCDIEFFAGERGTSQPSSLYATVAERLLAAGYRKHPALHGFCPMGCGPKLAVGTDGRITCRSSACLRPTAVDELLADQETEHIVEFGEADFTIRHPLRERLDDALLTCDLHRWCARLDGPPAKPGTYRVRRSRVVGHSGWTFAEVDR